MEGNIDASASDEAEQRNQGPEKSPVRKKTSARLDYHDLLPVLAPHVTASPNGWPVLDPRVTAYIYRC